MMKAHQDTSHLEAADMEYHIIDNMQVYGVLPKGPYLPCVSMAGRALLAGYPRKYQVTDI